MNELKWVCERCKRGFDLQKDDGWVNLVDEVPSPEDGKLTPLVPYGTVCYECADEILAVVEKCNKDCLNCEATVIWGFSIRDCIKFQLKFELIKLPLTQQPLRGSIDEAREILKIFDRF